MPLDRFVDSLLDYFRLPEHKKSPPPGTGAKVEMPAAEPQVRPVTKSRVVPPENAPSQIGSPPARHPVGDDETILYRKPTRTAAAKPPEDSHETDEDPIRILLVEDDPKWAQLIKAYIAAINNERTLGALELVWVENLNDAQGKLSKHSYDLIFLDLMLPDSQGIHTLESVWERASSVQTPVIVMSNLDSGGVMDRVREITGRDILLKKNISKKVLFGHIDYNVFED